jgi:hypothetical protein
VRAQSALVGLLMCACASTPAARGPFFDDEKYLRFGVEPSAEADALIKERERIGDGLSLRVRGQHFTALGFVDRQGQPSVVRVVTARGIALALDGARAAALNATESFELLAPPRSDTQDADGDGFEEVFLAHTRGALRCVRVYRVRDVGFVDLVPTDLTLFGQTSCASAMEDVDGDGHIELVVTVPLDGVAFPTQATVRVPLWARQHRFTHTAAPEALAAWNGAERSPRALELGEARRLLDIPWALQLAFELAALEVLDGKPAAAQLQTFDTALAGLVLTPDEQQAVRDARARIERAWNAPPVSPDTR